MNEISKKSPVKEPLHTGRFVEDIRNKREKIERVQNTVHDLEQLLKPYSTDTGEEGLTGQDRPQPCTEMDTELDGLDRDIETLHSMITDLIDNFNG